MVPFICSVDFQRCSYCWLDFGSHSDGFLDPDTCYNYCALTQDAYMSVNICVLNVDSDLFITPGDRCISALAPWGPKYVHAHKGGPDDASEILSVLQRCKTPCKARQPHNKRPTSSLHQSSGEELHTKLKELHVCCMRPAVIYSAYRCISTQLLKHDVFYKMIQTPSISADR